MKDLNKIVRRRHSAELKAQVLSECAQPGSSVARVALSHGVNANVVRTSGAASQALRPCQSPRSFPWRFLLRLARAQ